MHHDRKKPVLIDDPVFWIIAILFSVVTGSGTALLNAMVTAAYGDGFGAFTIGSLGAFGALTSFVILAHLIERRGA